MHKRRIYTVGGTVQASGGRYVERTVDQSLLDLCQKGEFGFVLTARQMGKSSLMVRTAERLRESGTRTVIIDLSQIGVQLTDEAWYLGLLTALEDVLDLDTDLFDWWEANSHLGFGQRLTNFFENIVLVEVDEPVVVFVDEIDSTLSLPFTDDFFAAIRYIYNARANTPAFKRLSFVLIGVATPNDLISDPARTPFNIGHQVDVKYFTTEEALPLADGFDLSLDESKKVLDWVMDWTNGHPFLTQRLCAILAAGDATTITKKDVDRAVASTFFGEHSEEDSNLRFVHDMLTRRAHDINEVLSTYRQIYHKKGVKDDRQSHTITHLKLSGVVHRQNGNLMVSNAIYRSVFDGEWLKRQWPEHWLKRVPPAVRWLVAASFVAVFLGFLLLLQVQANAQAEEEAALQAENLTQATLANERLDSLNSVLDTQFNQADSLRETAQIANAQLAEQARVSDNLRGEAEGARVSLEDEVFTTDSLNQVVTASNSDLAVAVARADSLTAVAEQRLEDARLARLETLTLGLANAAHRQVRLRNPVLGALLARQAYLFSQQGEGEYSDAIYDALVEALNEVSPIEGDPAGGPVLVGLLESPVRAVAQSADERWIAAGQESGVITLISNGSERVTRTLRGHQGAVRTIVFSPIGDRIASAGDDGTIRIWQIAEGGTISTILGRHNASVWTIAFAPDGRTIVSAGADHTVRTWVVESGLAGISLALRPTERIRSMAYSPDESVIVLGDETGMLRLWKMSGDRPVSWNAEQGRIQALAFHPDGSYFVSGGDGAVVRQWKLTSGSSLAEPGYELRGHEGPVNALAFSGNGMTLASGSSDHSIQVWDTERTDASSLILQHHTSWVWSLAVNADGSRIVSGGADRSIQYWNLDLNELANRVCEYSNGQQLASQDWDQYVGSDFNYDTEYLPCASSAVAEND